VQRVELATTGNTGSIMVMKGVMDFTDHRPDDHFKELAA
jgi:hypothetical protein